MRTRFKESLIFALAILIILLSLAAHAEDPSHGSGTEAGPRRPIAALPGILCQGHIKRGGFQRRLGPLLRYRTEDGTTSIQIEKTGVGDYAVVLDRAGNLKTYRFKANGGMIGETIGRTRSFQQKRFFLFEPMYMDVVVDESGSFLHGQIIQFGWAGGHAKKIKVVTLSWYFRCIAR